MPLSKPHGRGGAVSVGGRGDTDDRETGEDDKGHPGRGTREGTMPGRPQERSRIKQWGSRAAGRAAGRPGDLREDSLVEAAEAAAGFHGLRGRGERGRADSEHGCLSTALAMKRRRGPGLCLTDTWGWGGVKVEERGEGVDSEQLRRGLSLTPDCRPPSGRWAFRGWACGRG